MSEIITFSKTLGELPVVALVALVVLAAFALAAFTIHVNAKTTRRR